MTDPGESSEEAAGRRGPEDSSKFFDPSAEAETSLPPTGRPDTEPGDQPSRIGPYRILHPIGEGGMGTVYLAEQKDPIVRRVALKIIKLGMDSKEIIARFETERQALAMMNHPNIARVLDAGTSSEGRPYFVMEHVPGIPITKYCDDQRLRTRERLELFLQACEAVQHSHQKGIIHRDIKPSNILVTAQERDEPLVKIIDFGIAKATEHRLTEKTLFTDQGQMIGTPEYMSPEQTDRVGIDVDTRADIYSLGVLLYELLVGDLPFRLGAFAFVEVIRRIREEEPVRPSTKATTQYDAHVAARARRTDTRSLARQLRGELDWITLKAMDKDRTRRYAAATDLAADIRRYLSHEPVVAGPPSAAYRLRKLVRKNLAAAMALATVFLALTVGGTTATVFYFQAQGKRLEAETARDEADRERREANLQRQEAVEARQRERVQRRIAEQARNLAQMREEQARENLQNFTRLADVKRFQDRLAEAEELFPAHPDQIPAMRSWLTRAQELASRLPLHRESLAELRKRALSSSGENRYSFESEEDQWLHDTLSGLVADLDRFVDPVEGPMAGVSRRLATAETCREVLEDEGMGWAEAIASIRDECPVYEGLEITAQVGLVPIGRDPNSGLWEFGHILTGEIPDRDADRAVIRKEEMSLVFVLIPGGSFRMGGQGSDPEAPNYDPEAEGNESPVERIELTPFFLSKYEMTQTQWERVAGTNPSLYRRGNYGDRWDRLSPSMRRRSFGLHPVEQVTWEECDRLMKRLGLRLPTEAQWEYGARATTTTVYWTGNEVETLEGAANIADTHARTHGGSDKQFFEGDLDDGFTVHAPVGSFRANRFGLHDVVGNVWEWCRDAYPSYSLPSRNDDGFRVAEEIRSRILRGGSFYNSAPFARSAKRKDHNPEIVINYLGLRPARPLDP